MPTTTTVVQAEAIFAGLTRVSGGRYYSLTCQLGDCCPPEGTPINITYAEEAQARQSAFGVDH